MATTELLTTDHESQEKTGTTNKCVIDINPCIDLNTIHSCSLYTFLSELSPNHQLYDDILHLVSKYYLPQQTSAKSIQENLQTAIDHHKVQCNSVPIPSWKLTTDHPIKRYPSLCPYLSQHLTLEILFWILVLVFFKSGVPSIGSCAVLFVFYALIQCMVWSMGYLYTEGFYRYKHIESVPLYDKEKRISYLNKKFSHSPTVTASMDLHESSTMADMGWDTVEEQVCVKECATFIEPDLGNEDDKEYRNWLYCIEYETDVDFMNKENRLRFEKLCARFIKRNIREDMVYHAFNVKIMQNLCAAYNDKYWSGYIMIVNTECKMSVNFLLIMIKLLNILCLSLLYKIPLYFVRRKRLNIVKYLGFSA